MATSILALLVTGCAAPDNAMDSGLADTADDASSGEYQSAEVCAECHPNQYAEWRQSMHAYAARSPVFDAMAGKAFRDSGGALGTFCTGCHTPQGEDAGEPGSSVAATRSELSKESITCDACHTAVGHDGPIGDARIDRELGMVKRGPLEGGTYPTHIGEYSDFVTSSRFCGSCHDVFAFPGLRIEEAFTEYSESPAAADGVRCQDCHMSPEPGIPGGRETGPAAIVDGVPTQDRELVNHRFIGPDYTLLTTFPYPDDEEASAAAREDYLTRSEQLLKNALQIADVRTVMQGDVLNVQVGLENITSGHRVPTGFTSERQVWIELTVTASDGRIVTQSGDLDSNGDLKDLHSWDVESGAAQQDLQLVNLQSTNLSVYRAFRDDGSFRNPEPGEEDLAFRNEIFPFDANTIIKNSIEPLSTNWYPYNVGINQGTVDIHVRLQYRNLPPYVLRALGLDDYIERLHTYTIDEWEQTIDLSTVGSAG